MKTVKPKYNVNDIVYRLTCLGIEKNKIINVWKHSDCYSYDIIGGNVSEHDLYSSVQQLIKYLKSNIDDVTIG